VTDEVGKKRQSTTDALGRLTQVVEDPVASGYVTNYTYDALDNLLSIVQNGSRQRTFNYNSLRNSPAPPIPNPAPSRTLTTPNGNLASKTDPAPNQLGTATVTTTYAYDALKPLDFQDPFRMAHPPWPTTMMKMLHGALPYRTRRQAHDHGNMERHLLANWIHLRL